MMKNPFSLRGTFFHGKFGNSCYVPPSEGVSIMMGTGFFTGILFFLLGIHTRFLEKQITAGYVAKQREIAGTAVQTVYSAA